MMDTEAWHAAVHGVAESWTQLSNSTTTEPNVSRWHSKLPGSKITVASYCGYILPFGSRASKPVRPKVMGMGHKNLH